jgi:apocytochrome f
MEAAGVDKLTAQQKKETKEAFDNVQKADANATAAMEAYREEIAKLKAENELLKQKKTASKPKEKTTHEDYVKEREGFREELKKATEGVVISPYSDSKQNILVVGPISGNDHQKIIFPILAPNPAENRDVHFIKYPIYVGANRGRGQVQPTGEKSNNTIYNSPVSGQIVKIDSTDKLTTLTINSKSGDPVNVKIPNGPEIIVKQGDNIEADQPLTIDPNVGGFGQGETEVVLQSPARVKGMIAFFFTVIFAQILLVLKKKQFEKVQAAELDF